MSLNALLFGNTEDLINRDESTIMSFEDCFDSKEEYEEYIKKWQEFDREQNYKAGMSALAAEQTWVGN